MYDLSKYDEQHYARIRDAMSSLIRATLESQTIFTDAREKYDDLNFVDSYCTVKYGGPRRMGHTTAMVKVGTEMFKNPAFFCLSEDQCRNVRSRFPVKKDQMYSIRSDVSSKLMGREHDAVFIDCAFFAPPSTLYEIKRYVRLMANKFDGVCLILIG